MENSINFKKRLDDPVYFFLLKLKAIIEENFYPCLATIETKEGRSTLRLEVIFISVLQENFLKNFKEYVSYISSNYVLCSTKNWASVNISITEEKFKKFKSFKNKSFEKFMSRLVVIKKVHKKPRKEKAKRRESKSELILNPKSVNSTPEKLKKSVAKYLRLESSFNSMDHYVSVVYNKKKNYLFIPIRKKEFLVDIKKFLSLKYEVAEAPNVGSKIIYIRREK